MRRRLCFSILLALILSALATEPVEGADASLVGWWKFDGNTRDSSAYGNHGTLQGDPQWVLGMMGEALDFDGSGDYVEVPHDPTLSLTDAITIAAWTYMHENASGEMAIVSKGGWGANDLPYELTEEAGAVIFWQFYDDAGRDTCAPDSPPVAEWHHIAATYDGTIFQCYIDAILADEWEYAGTMPENTAAVTIGRRSRGGTHYEGMLDEVMIYNRALDGREIAMVMTGTSEMSSEPTPEDGAVDVPRDVVLGWVPGQYAASHDVYLGTVHDDVNAADRDTPLGTLVSQGQSDVDYDPEGLLDYGQTYYWRVDEVNAAPDSTIFKGETWSFTAEPFAYPIENVAATSNAASNAGEGPENAVNGSGLDARDQHSTVSSDMWLAQGGGETVWIQFAFDRVYKLHEIQVWNYNVMFELILGFGLKNVTIEYSVDGVEWTVLDDVEFAQATAKADYTANTTIEFGGAAAQHVRFIVNSGWGALPQYGLSEVRFLYIPAHARQPQPSDGAEGVSIETELGWRAGRDAVSHDVYFGIDPEALDLAGNVETPSFSPETLDLGTTYYWQVDAIRETESWAGDLWSFATQACLMVDDFEGYDDDANRIYDTWIDGFGVDDNGSQVGHLEEPFAETSVVRTGRQSMPLFFDNTSAPLSEAELAVGQDWTASGIQSLTLYFHGAEGNTGQLYVKIDGTKVLYDGDAGDIASLAWLPWTIDLSVVGGNLTNVGSLAIGVEGAGAVGVVYIDDVQLCP